MQRACFDCDGNETTWPWYGCAAPVSWLVYNDTMEGRSRMNFSEWKTRSNPGISEIIVILQEGEISPAITLPMHPAAQLTTDEKQRLISALTNSLR